MRILVLGADGYLGWPTMLYFAKLGHEVIGVDNYSKRRLCQQLSCMPAQVGRYRLNDREIFIKDYGFNIKTYDIDCAIIQQLENVIKLHKPDVIVHYAEQPSAPYSMRGYGEARYTLENNLGTTLALIHATKKLVPNVHIIKLGTMGEYGTPNWPISEGWLKMENPAASLKQNFLYPMSPSSLYHVTKVQDTHMLWFYSKMWGLTVTDIMQGPVYGLQLEGFDDSPIFEANFHYDDIFGTVVNRFIAQAILGIPLTIYGKGGQTRGYLNINDTMQSIELLINNPPKDGEFRIVNQFTELFSINQIAKMVIEAAEEVGIKATAQHLPNPRIEQEQHYYNVEHKILEDLGLKSRPLSKEFLKAILLRLKNGKYTFNKNIVMPQVSWR